VLLEDGLWNRDCCPGDILGDNPVFFKSLMKCTALFNTGHGFYRMDNKATVRFIG